MRIKFVDLSSKFHKYRNQLHAALDKVIDDGQVILGDAVDIIENSLCQYLNANYVTSVANGTDALLLILRKIGIIPGDEIITTPMSYLASTSPICMMGATPIYCDVGDDLNISITDLPTLITRKTKAILLVHLAGNPAKIVEIRKIAHEHKIILIEDCAQAFGATYNTQSIGTFGDYSAFSFHPLKTLGALGDAGAIVCNTLDDDIWFKMARNHGHISREDCAFWSINSRLDNLQARFLSCFLSDYSEYLLRRKNQIDHYKKCLNENIKWPRVHEMTSSNFGMCMVLAERRDELKQYLEMNGIETAIHYPKLLPYLSAQNSTLRYKLPNAEKFVNEIISLPIGDHIHADQIDYICKKINQFYTTQHVAEKEISL